jgi:hypothetical protein
MPDIYEIHNEIYKVFICESIIRDHLMMNIWFGFDDIPF